MITNKYYLVLIKVVYLRGGVFDSSDLSTLMGDGVLDLVVGDARFLSFTEASRVSLSYIHSSYDLLHPL